mmetsp:Transcript_125571/g.313774  ORF Transcript_125571/g.313774 Transcript_125571/m.313774 type:complete len:348 (+) Transcript_125571:75-1118(+)
MLAMLRGGKSPATPSEPPADQQRVSSATTACPQLSFDKQREAELRHGHFARISIGMVNYKLWGLGDGTRPLVVTLHGLLGNMGTFTSMAQDLVRGGFDVLTFDLFGFGLSDSPRKRFDVKLFADQTLELLSYIGFPNKCKFLLVGFSMGGLIAMEVARRSPERIARLMLVAPAGLVPLNALERSGIKALRAARALHIPAATVLGKLAGGLEVQAELFEPDVSDSRKSAEVAEKNCLMFRSNPEKYTKAWLKSVRDMRLGGNGQLYSLLAESGVEVMFLWGDSDSTVPLAEIQEELRGFFPRAPVLIVKGAGHGLLAEHSDVVAQYAFTWFNGGVEGLRVRANGRFNI